MGLRRGGVAGVTTSRVELEVVFNPDTATLVECEAIIERGAKSFVEVGTALLAIRDRKLYRATHSRFTDYTKERWGYAQRYSYQLMDAAKVCAVAHVSNEWQARELVPLKDDPELLREALEEAKDAATALGSEVTAPFIRDAVAKRRPKKPRHVKVVAPGGEKRSSQSAQQRLQRVHDTLDGLAAGLEAFDTRGEPLVELLEATRQQVLRINRALMALKEELG